MTINIEETSPDNTNVRVSASGELEQDGKILNLVVFMNQNFSNDFLLR